MKPLSLSFLLLFMFLHLLHAVSLKGTILYPNGDIAPLSIVSIEELSFQTVTDDSGHFFFKNIPTGNYLIYAEKDTLFDTLRINLDRDLEIKIILQNSLPHTARNRSREPKFFTVPSKRGKRKITEREAVKEKTEDMLGVSPEKRGKIISGAKRKTGKSSSSGLKAGFADDNKQFNYFLRFLEQYKDTKHLDFPIHERIWLKVYDSSDRPVNNARIQVYAHQKLVDEGKTYADGSFFLYPLSYVGNDSLYWVSIEKDNVHKKIQVHRYGPRKIIINLNGHRPAYQKIPLDLLFILDVTGSMGEEIQRLKNTIDIINRNLLLIKPVPDIRFGLVLYRDKEDEFVTRMVPFSHNLDYFQKVLNTVEAGGGGDTPEDLQSALQVTMKQMSWREDAVRLGYIITDAPPHLDYDQDYSYIDACKDAHKMGIKLYSVGTGGLNIQGEYILRQIAQLTYGKYIFLTYGEQGESEGGVAGSVSHHTGANYQTDKLESIIIRFTKEELSYQSDQPLLVEESYFEAQKIDEETREETLQLLFDQAIQELIDYSLLPIDTNMKVAVLPITSNQSEYQGTAEYFSEQLLLSARKKPYFTLVERKDLQKIFEELKLQLSGVIKEEDAAKVGELMGAQMLIMGNMYKVNDHYELFLKLERVRTAEILSMTKAKIDVQLGL